MKDVYNAAIIGCGRIGSLFDKDPKRKHVSSHAGAYTKHPKTKIISVCDADNDKAQQCAKDWNVGTVYNEYEKMLGSEDIDILSICTWNDTHEKIVEAALDNGVKAIFCEKPISYSIASAQRMAQSCRQKNAPLAINHFRRWDPFHIRLKSIIEKGTIGEIQNVSFYYTRGIANSGVHLVDLLCFLFGDAKSVCTYNAVLDFGDDPTLGATVEMQSGVLCQLIACNGNAFRIFEMDILGTEGRIKIHNGRVMEGFLSKPSPNSSEFKELQQAPELAFSDGCQGYFPGAVSNIIAAIEKGDDIACSGGDGVKSLELVIAMLKSKELERKLSLPLPEEFSEEVLYTK